MNCPHAFFAGLLALCALHATAAEIRASVRDGKDHAVEDAVVMAVPANRQAMVAAPHAGHSMVEQIDKEFVPYVKPVHAGSLVLFPNRDTVLHHVYSFSPAKRFELPLYAGTEAAPITFDKPGAVVIGCNIHDWMIGHVYVTDTPFFAKTGADGKAAIANLPSGEYVLRVWHPLLIAREASTERPLAVSAGTANVEWRLELKPPFRIPRQPAKRGGAYR
jgi:plastocyanin